MSDNPLDNLMQKHGDRVRATVNLLLESAYFYRTDNETLFSFLRQHEPEFQAFFQRYFGWELIRDNKCARLYKPKWYNEHITEANRHRLDFRKRDEALGFLLLLDFFEHQLLEQNVTVADAQNLLFRFGDLLEHAHRRMQEVMPEVERTKYSTEYVRKAMLRPILPVLVRYRFLREVEKPGDIEKVELDDTLFEALPAMYHYNAHRLSQPIGPRPATREEEPDADA